MVLDYYFKLNSTNRKRPSMSLNFRTVGQYAGLIIRAKNKNTLSPNAQIKIKENGQKGDFGMRSGSIRCPKHRVVIPMPQKTLIR